MCAGIAEMLAMEMKSTGMYVSRGLSYKQAEVREKLSGLFIQMSNESVPLALLES